MSKLSYRLQQALDESGSYGQKPTLLQKIKAIKYLFIDLYYDYPHHWIWTIKQTLKNLRFFMPHIINMRPWDYSYQITLFADSLEYLAKGLKDGHALSAEKQYRRAMTAAGKLRKAYSYGSWDDKSYRNWTNRNPMVFTDLGDGFTSLSSNPKDGEEYSDKMYKIIRNRQEKEEAGLKKVAWEYLHKHIEHWWN